MLLYHGAPRKIIQIQAVPEYQKQQNYIGDFGTGFYLTPDKDFASERALIARNEEAYLYTYDVNEDIFSELNIFRFPETADLAWLMFIAYNRKNITREQAPHLCDSIDQTFKNYDVIIGPSSDDRCFYHMICLIDPPDVFFYANFNEVLLDLQKNPLREQYVFKSEKACEKLKSITPSIYQFSEKEITSFPDEFFRRNDDWYQNAKPVWIKRGEDEGPSFKKLMEMINTKKVMFSDLPALQEELKALGRTKFLSRMRSNNLEK